MYIVVMTLIFVFAYVAFAYASYVMFLDLLPHSKFSDTDCMFLAAMWPLTLVIMFLAFLFGIFNTFYRMFRKV